VLSNGEVVKFGPEGGVMQEEFTVPPSEWITWIKVKQGEHLDSIQFYTNRGTPSPFYGGPGGRKAIFHVKRGNEVIGLARINDGEAVSPSIKGIEEQTHRALIITETAGGGSSSSSNGSSNGNRNGMNPNTMQVLR